jgi:protease IV
MKEYFIWLLKLATGFFLTLLFLGVLLPATLQVMSKKPSSVAGKNQVAVVELKGEITDSRDVMEQLHEQVANDDIKGIVLRIDSPGGAVGPSQEMYRTILALKEKKPIVASCAGVAASGGFYTAVAASKVFALPGTATGSIGVILRLLQASKLSQTVGVSYMTIKSGKLKDAGDPFREMNDDERNYFEDLAKGIHEDFIQAVSSARNVPIERVRPIADGRVISGQQALDLKLIDEIGTLHEAARAIFELRKEPLPEGEYPTLVYPAEDKLARIKSLFSSLTAWIPSLHSPFEFRYQVQ